MTVPQTGSHHILYYDTDKRADAHWFAFYFFISDIYTTPHFSNITLHSFHYILT